MRGELSVETSFPKAAEQFIREYEVITDGQRSPKWVQGHKDRLRPYLFPFFGELDVSHIAAGKLQDYRIHL